jgi:hypothetical protein
MQIIGLYGTKRSGKDTVYKLLKDSSKGFSINLRREAFADNLKQEVADVLGIGLDKIENDKERFRPMLQWYGADYRRFFSGEYYWVDQMIRKIQRNSKSKTTTVITDVRYPNEADLVKSRGVLIKVERDTGLEDMHSSETAMQDFSDFDYILKNDSSLEVLKERVQNLFCQIKDQA